MRGIAALLVVLFHYRFMLNNRYAQDDLGGIFSYGGVGVDLFFMISGFIISFSTKSDLSKRNFIIKRFFRIFPIYWLALAILFIIVPSISFDANMLKSIFLVQWDYNSNGPFFGYSTLVTAWTLSFEVVFYFIFAISMWISHKYRSYICSILIMISVFSMQLFYNGAFSYSGYTSAQADISAIKILSSPMLFEFIAGMMVYEFMRMNLKVYENKHFKYFINIAFWISLAYAIACYLSGYNRGHGLQGYGFHAGFLFFFWLLNEKINTLRDNKPLRLLGDWSYSIYIVHFSILMVIPYIDDYFLIFKTSYGASKFVFLLLITMIMSKVLFDYVEKGVMKYSKRLMK